MKDAIDELVARSKSHRELQAFHDFHRKHPEVLDFLVQEIRFRIDHGFMSFSFHSLWDYARWKLEMRAGPGDAFAMNDHAAPFYSRAITILHPEFNGLAEFRRCRADEVFGTDFAPLPKHRRRQRLMWADGTPLEKGWRPEHPHIVAAVNRKRDIHPRSA
jgi:hypothetical protein